MTGSTAIQRDRTAAYVPALMEVSGVTKRYGEQRALADISFTVNPGEVLGLIGPNGAGKTTLLEAIAGLVRRLMLALALITPQPLLFMDEPFDGFDLRQTREVMGVVREVARQGRTLALAIHPVIAP